jgi:GT2 family glycosyltransferase
MELGAERILLLNNDIIIAPDLVEKMLAAADAHPDFGIMGPVINFMDEPDAVMTDGVVFNSPGPPGSFFGRLEVPPRSGGPPVVTSVDIVNGCALMVSAEVIRRIGLVDERFFLIHEEADLCLRAVAAGIGCGVFAETLVWHKGSSSFARTGSRFQRYYDSRNLILLLRKHAMSHRRGRSLARSWFEYFRYVYYRWSIEREAGERDAARAVVAGILDAFAGRWGAWRERRHPMRWLVEVPFAIIHGRR